MNKHQDQDDDDRLNPAWSDPVWFEERRKELTKKIKKSKLLKTQKNRSPKNLAFLSTKV